MSMAIAFWLLGNVSIFGHLLKAVAAEPGTFSQFFDDKKNTLYLLINILAAYSLLITYAATTPIDTVGAITFATMIAFGTGTAARTASPSENMKEQKREMAQRGGDHQ